MRKFQAVVVVILFIALGNPGAWATSALDSWGFNLNGTIFSTDAGNTPGDLPVFFNSAGFNWNTGLGTITLNYNPGPGSFHILSFFDHEVNQELNTFFNETGAPFGVPAPGQSWEIDEPGFVNGDIFVNFKNKTLDNGVGTSIFGNTTFPDDVSMAMGWNFVLAPGESATISFILSNSPQPVFFLRQTEPTGEAINFRSSLSIEGVRVPEPFTLILLGSGLMGIIGLRGKWGIKNR